MCDAACELTERIEFLRLGELALNLQKFVMRFLALGDIAGDLRKTDQLTRVTADGIDDNTGPKKRSVLADPPPFFIVAPGFECNLQRSRRLSGGLIRGRVEK